MNRMIKYTFLTFTTALLAVPSAAFHAAETASLPPSAANVGVNVIVEANAPPAVRQAAMELRTYLRQLYPTAAGKQIRLATTLSTPESYEITATENEATIAGGGLRGVVYGVYALLEKLGCGFYLSGDEIPAVRREPLLFKDWRLADKPLVPTPRVQLAQLSQRLLDLEPAGVASVDTAVAEDARQCNHGPCVRQQSDGGLHFRRNTQAGGLSLNHRQGPRLVYNARQQCAATLRRRSLQLRRSLVPTLAWCRTSSVSLPRSADERCVC